MRMFIALLIGCVVMVCCGIHLPRSRKALILYFYSGVGVFGGMLFSYFSAEHISSGLMSLIFGFSPIITGVLAQKIIYEPKFSFIKKVALSLAVIGLLIVCYDNILLSGNSYLGVVYVLLAVGCFSISAVLVKSIELQINPVATTVGALLFATPLFFFTWLIFDGNLPYQQWQAKSIWSIIYLGIVGSLIGFLAYFYILQKLSTSTVALVTMLTPIFALLLGNLFNNEVLTVNLVIGAVFVICGLSFFLWGDSIKKRVF